MIREPTSDPHEHFCFHCGRWYQLTGEEGVCPRCLREGPAIHGAIQLLGAWGLNVFLEEAGVSEGLLDPVWHLRISPGRDRDEVVLEAGWTSADGPAMRALVRSWSKAVGLDPLAGFRRRSTDQGTFWVARERYSLGDFRHPAGLYRTVAVRTALLLVVFMTLADSSTSATRRKRPPRSLGWAGEWLSRFLAAPPLLDPRRLSDRVCPRCFHDQAGYFEPMCTYFRDDPELAWGSGSEPWYELMLAAGDFFADPSSRTMVLGGPDGGLPPVPLEGPAEAFGLIGRVIAHFRPRRCIGFVVAGKMLSEIEEWASGRTSLVELANNTLDPLLIKVAGERLTERLTELFEGRLNPSERKTRRPAEIALAGIRLQNLAEWLSAGSLDGNSSRR